MSTSVSDFRYWSTTGNEVILRYHCADKAMLELATASYCVSGGRAWNIIIDLMYNGMAWNARVIAEEGGTLKRKDLDCAKMAEDILEMSVFEPYVNYLKDAKLKDTFIIKEFKLALEIGDLTLAKKLAKVAFPKFRKDLQRIIAISKGALRYSLPFPASHILFYTMMAGVIIFMIPYILYKNIANSFRYRKTIIIELLNE